MIERDIGGDDIVNVPVPRWLLPAVYRVLADGMTRPDTDGAPTGNPAVVDTEVTKRPMIDFIIESAHQIGADRQPVSLTDLYNAYRRSYPGLLKGATHGSFDATVNFYCINMKSRFPDAKHKEKLASWLSRPVFKRIARAQYMLLTDDEIARFQHAHNRGDPLIYENEYDVADLAGE